MKKERICFISSTGGHLAQLTEIIEAFRVVDIRTEFSVITEKSESTKDLNKKYPTNFLIQQDRGKFIFILILVMNILKSLVLIFKLKPSVIISTGAGCVLPFCFFGKIIGSKVVFIESYAKVNTPTLTGKIIYKFADRFYIQWSSLSKHYPKALHRGQIY